MSIKSLSIKNFRILDKVDLSFSSDVNIFYGLNGSGKTSILESLFYLSRGKSFKQSQSSKLISFSKNEFILFSVVNSLENSIQNIIGISKSHQCNNTIKVNNEFIYSNSFLTKFLTIQIINPDSHLLIDSGPSTRRKFLDWIVFHVKHELFNDWKRYKKIVKNRNTALKNKLSDREITAWDNELIRITELITEDRKNFTELFNQKLQLYKKEFLAFMDISLEFYEGWSSNKFLFKEALNDNFIKDKIYGTTSQGLHKADIKMYITKDSKQYLIKDILSNGQKKYLSLLLYIIELELYIDKRNSFDIKPILLIDDITSELDTNYLFLLFKFISQLDIQIFITLMETEDNFKLIQKIFSESELYRDKYSKLFHVKQGMVNSKKKIKK